jgi:Family of unknown function (DUF5309)
MVQLAGTTSSYDLKNRRESYEDVIYRVSAKELPLLGRIGKSEKAEDIRHDWNLDALAVPNTANAMVDGDDYTYTKQVQPTRLGNLCQISRKEFLVSGTAETVKKAGMSKNSEIGYLKVKHGIELMRDIEAVIISTTQASLLGADATARKAGSLASFLTSNAGRGVGGVNGGYSTGTGLTVSPTDGTQRAFSQALLDAAALGTAALGEMPKLIMAPPVQKQKFSTFVGAATSQTFIPQNSKDRTIIQGADYYKGDFGEYEVVPNYIMQIASTPRTREVYLLNPDFLELVMLRDVQTQVLAKTGDSEKRAVLAEWTLKVGNEAAHAVIADLT